MESLHTIVLVFAALVHCALLAAAFGYTRLLVKGPSRSRAAFPAVMFAIAGVLAAGFQYFGYPRLERTLAEPFVDAHMKEEPAVALVAGRHPSIREAYLRLVIVRSRSGDGDSGAVSEAARVYAEELNSSATPYLAVASDAALLEFAEAGEAVLEALDEPTGASCGAMLNTRLPEMAGLVARSGPQFAALGRARDAAIASAFSEPRPALSDVRAAQIDASLTEFLAVRFGRLRAGVLIEMITAAEPPDDPELCQVVADLFRYAFGLPSPDREDTIRFLFEIEPGPTAEAHAEDGPI